MHISELPTLLSSLTLRQKVAQLICPYIICDQVDDAGLLTTELETNPYGGFILFGGALRTQTLINHLQNISAIPLLIAADIECGTGQQITGAAYFPTNMALAATGKVEYAYLQGYYTAREAKMVGINWAFAPVIDVNSNPDNPIINIRAFAEEPHVVARMGEAFIRGCQEQGVLATAKHFPGHGNTHLDSHTALPVIASTLADFEQTELLPFRVAIAAGVASIMTAHIAVPVLEPQYPDLPATLSHGIMTTLLREQLGFKGLVVTDAMIMAGVKGLMSEIDTTIMALQAGCDVILMPQDPTGLLDGLVQAVEDARLPLAVVERALERVLRVKLEYDLWSRRFTTPEQLQDLCQPEMARVILRMVQESLTLLRNDLGHVPLTLGQRVLSLVLNDDDYPDMDHYWQQTLTQYAGEIKRLEYNSQVDLNQLQQDLDEALVWADLVVVPVYVMIKAAKDRLALAAGVEQLLTTITKTQKPWAVAVFGNPYVIRQFAWLPTYACAYMIHPCADQEMLRALFGQLPFVGKCMISGVDGV